MAETRSAQRQRNVRQKLTPLVKAQRRAVRVKRELDQVEEEFDLTLGLSAQERKSARGRAVLAAADARMKEYRALEEVQQELLAHGRGERPDLSEQEVEKMRARRTEFFHRLNEMPVLGSTREEWEALPDELKSKRLGRPKLSLEQRLIRARKAHAEAIAVLREEEAKAGAGKTDLSKVKDPTLNTSHGRPASTRLDHLDAEIRRHERMIAEIDSGAAAREEEAQEATSRARMTLAEKRAKYQARIDRLAEQITRMEQNLGPLERVKRDLKKVRHEFRQLKSQVQAGEVGPHSKEARRIDYLAAEIERLAAERNKLEFAEVEGDKAAQRALATRQRSRRVVERRRYKAFEELAKKVGKQKQGRPGSQRTTENARSNANPSH